MIKFIPWRFESFSFKVLLTFTLTKFIISYFSDEKETTPFDYSDIPVDQRAKAIALFSTISSVIKQKHEYPINLNSNFYELGGNSLNSVYTVLKLREKGYHIGITDFITAKSMKDVLSNSTLILIYCFENATVELVLKCLEV